jgi:hypothetical protein
MGIKGLHAYLRKVGAYDDVDLKEFVKEQPIDTIVVDFCAFYMAKLKSPRYAAPLLLAKVFEKNSEPGSLGLPLALQSPQEIVAALIKEIGDEMDGLVGSLFPQPRVCFVLDGEPLLAKRDTHKLRARRSYQHLKAARRLVNLYIGRQTQTTTATATATAAAQFLARLAKKASGWIRWFGPLKQLIVAELVRHCVADGFDLQGSSKYSIVVAPFEADPRCVDIANQCERAVILSNDGDLQIYPFADNALVGWTPSVFFFFQMATPC